MTFTLADLRSSHEKSPRKKVNLNKGWDFRIESENSTDGEGQSWSTVNLPHYGKVEPYDVSIHFQGLCWYRRIITRSPEMIDRKAVIEFEAGMQVAEVWVDQELRGSHDGGYLPFFIDLTEDFKSKNAVEIVVRLDNRDNPDVPPGKPLSRMDFCYWTGLYRNVWLHVTELVHITNACQVQKVASGGLFVRYENVSQESADILVEVDVTNESASPVDAVTEVYLIENGEKIIASHSSDTDQLLPGTSKVFHLRFAVDQPKLWSTTDPHLYHLESSVIVNSLLVDSVVERIGIRSLVTDPQTGFYINGKHIQPFGVNRHQAYPFVGNAVSDAAQYRDALKLKEAGFDIIRLAHYPQAPAFLDACDELGMLTIVCIPGWQHFSDTPRFRSNVIQDMRQTIRRDRNHPSTVLWETSLNETLGFDDILISLIEAAHEEYPGDQMLTCGDTESHDLKHVAYDVPYSGWDGVSRTRPNLAGKMSLHREYGDSQFGGYSRYSRGDGEALMLVQAWNYQTAVNDHLGLSYTWGQATWEAHDNNRGMSTEIATCGVMDPFRLPKFMYYFYQSQRQPFIEGTSGFAGPVIFIANYWQDPGFRSIPFVVYSNCEEVELFINGISQGKRRPDDGPYAPFGDLTGFDLNYWKLGDSIPNDERIKNVEKPIFTGGNCQNLHHPPFTFGELPFMPGEAVAVGYIGGIEVVRTTVRTPEAPQKIVLAVDYSRRPLQADGADTVFVYAKIVDKNGTVVPTFEESVTFLIEGDAQLIGDNPRKAEAGIATILLRAGVTPCSIEITAKTDGVGDGTLAVEAHAE